MRARFLLAFTAALTLAGPASATLLGYGDTVTFIADVKAVGAKNEPLFIGYRTSHFSILAGVYLKNEGYVLGLRADHDRYYDMPEGDELKRYQARGLLPDPLPAYGVGILAYTLGYSFWALVLALAGGGFVAFRMLRKKSASSTAESAADASAKAKGEVAPAFGLLLALFRKRQAKDGAVVS